MEFKFNCALQAAVKTLIFLASGIFFSPAKLKKRKCYESKTLERNKKAMPGWWQTFKNCNNI